MTHPDWVIRTPKAAEIVASQLRERIIRGEFNKGDNLPSERDMLERLGISRPTLREAYRVLESEGMITISRGVNGGARVNQPTSVAAARYTGMLLQHLGTTFAELAEARAMIQVPSVGKLARSASPEDVDYLRRLLEKDPEAADPETAVSAVTSFHSAIVRLAGNTALSVLSDMVEQIFDVGTHKLIRLQASNGESKALAKSHSAHDKIVTLIEEGDVERAEAFWRSHLMAAAKVLTPLNGGDSPIDVLP